MKMTDELMPTHRAVWKVMPGFSTENPQFQESAKILCQAIEEHAWIQDEVFLPSLRGKPFIDKNFIAELVQEHEDLNHLLSLLLKVPAEQKLEAQAYVTQVRMLLEAHLKKEKDALYPLAEM